MEFIIFHLRRFFVFLTDAFLFPFQKFRQLWSDPKRGRAMIFGLPALLVAIAGIGAALVAMSSKSRFTSNYEIAKQRAEKNAEAGDETSWGEAIVYMRKIMQLRPNDPATKWELAQVLNSDTREETSEANHRTASSILLSLSPEDEPGYPKAHVWRANQYLNHTDRRVPAKLKLARAEDQLRFALDTDPDNEDALILLAERILIPQKQFSEALRIYIDLFEDYEAYHIKIAELHVALGSPDDAKPYIQEAIERYTKLIEEDPHNVDYLRRRANAHAMLVQHDIAAETLLDAIDVSKTPLDRKQLQTALSRIYLSRAMMFAKQAVTETDARNKFLDFVILAYQTDPENDAATTSLTRFGFSSYPQSPRALEAYDPRDNPNDATSVSLQVAGTNEVMTGDRLLGIRLLELSIQKNPGNHEALNNLAFTIMDSETNRALGLANRAISNDKRNAQYHDTRGNIYMRLGEWGKATNDLEFAAKDEQMKKKVAVFEALVECYRRQGMISSAASYQKKVDELKAQEDNSNNSSGPSE